MNIKSQFDGKEREFGIAPEHVDFIEGAWGLSLYAMLKRFTAGEWAFADVANVLSFALHGPRDSDRMALSLRRAALRMGIAPPVFPYPPADDVIAVLQRDGHGTYAELATAILSSAVFGDGGSDG